MNEKFSAPSPILICVAAILLNLTGSFVARTFELPLYLDTGGTIFIAMLSGYVPGIIVGFATNFLNSFVEESEMYYCSISIFVAIFTTFWARRGVFESLPKTLLAIPALAFATALLTVVIEEFLFCTGVVEVLNAIQMNFAAIYLREVSDKGLLILLMFAALRFVPLQVKNAFRGLGQRQAPLSAEIRRAVYSRKCPKSSLRTKILLILMLSSLFIAASIASISYRIFEQACVGVQIKIADGLATIAASEINPAKFNGYSTADFSELEENFLSIRNSNPDVISLSAEKFTAEGGRVIFTAGINSLSDKNILPHRDDLFAGKPIAPIIADDRLTLYKPVYDAAGKAQCYVVIEMSLGLISDYGRTFTAKVLALFSGCFVFVFVIGLRFVENNIVLPVNTMAYCAQNFAYDSNEICAQNVKQIERLKIRTGDEIENLYAALVKTTQDVLTYFEKLRRAKRQVAEMDKLAHRDSLTGIKNKAAYDETTARLDAKIPDGAEFCIVMIDVNYLKRVNDTYGHERGNEYLLNAARLICAVFGEEHIYRIGGDEFVAIIEGEKVSLCKYFAEQFKAEMARKNANKLLEPWEKISAAIGVAYCEANDKKADDVFKRADKEMYANKLAMKAARTA